MTMISNKNEYWYRNIGYVSILVFGNQLRKIFVFRFSDDYRIHTCFGIEIPV